MLSAFREINIKSNNVTHFFLSPSKIVASQFQTTIE